MSDKLIAKFKTSLFIYECQNCNCINALCDEDSNEDDIDSFFCFNCSEVNYCIDPFDFEKEYGMKPYIDDNQVEGRSLADIIQQYNIKGKIDE